MRVAVYSVEQLIDFLIVKTQLQLNNAIDWAAEYSKHPKYCVVIAADYHLTRIKTTLADCPIEFETVVFLSESSLKANIENCTTVKRLIEGKSIQNLVYANYDQWSIQLLKENIPFQKEVLIGDGIATMELYKKYWSSGNFHRLPMKWDKKLKLLLWGRIVRRLRIPRQLTLSDGAVIYTSYPIDDPRVVKQPLHSNLSGMERMANHILLIGQPLIERHYLTAATYRQKLAELIETHPERHFAYKPHPGESEDNISHIESLGYEVLRSSGQSVEDCVAVNPYGACVGFISTALMNIGIAMSDVKVYYIELPSSDWLCHPREVENAYRQFSHCGLNKYRGALF